MVAVGFMYPEGYVRQRISADGWQETEDEMLDREEAPITRVLDEQGKQLVVKVPFIDPPIHVAVWQVMVGRIPLYLMDTDMEINDPGPSPDISNHLYISDLEQRCSRRSSWASAAARCWPPWASSTPCSI